MKPTPLSYTALLATFAVALSAAAPVPEFASWPEGKSPNDLGKRVADLFVVTPHRNFSRPGPTPNIRYPETCTWYGALTFAQLTGDKGLTGKLAERFEPLFGEKKDLIPPPVHVDATVFGSVPLELYMQTKDERYLTVGLNLANKQWERPSDEWMSKRKPEERERIEQYIKEGLTWHTRYWIDDMYMITMVQSQAYRATKDAKYIDRTAKEMVSYLDKLQQENGLFYHSPESKFFWGRGNGWMAAGMSELLRSLPSDHPHRARILDGYRKMMATLLKYQSEDGSWRQLIDKPDAWPESSCTGMFTFAFITGVKHGWLDSATYAPAARKGWLALAAFFKEDGNIRDVCEGTNIHDPAKHGPDGVAYYLARKRIDGDFHGQAPVLWSASALLR